MTGVEKQNYSSAKKTTDERLNSLMIKSLLVYVCARTILASHQLLTVALSALLFQMTLPQSVTHWEWDAKVVLSQALLTHSMEQTRQKTEEVRLRRETGDGPFCCSEDIMKDLGV